MTVSKTVGEFRNVNGALVGFIACGEIDLPRARLKPISSNNPRAPKFEVEAINRNGRWVPYGALFEATAINTTGEIFYSGELDDQSWRFPMQVALFGTAEEGFRASWRRDDMARPAGGRAQRSRSGDDDEGGERSFGGGERGPAGGGFGGSTAPLGGEGGTRGFSTDLDEDVPF